MASLLDIGRSGVLTNQQQLATTGNNIANVGTDGYRRQVVTQVESGTVNQGGLYTGTGVYASQISRAFDQLTYQNLISASGSQSQGDTMLNALSQLDETLSSVGGYVTEGMNELFSTLSGIADDPSDLSQRSLFLEQSQQLTGTLNELDASLQAQLAGINGQIDSTVAQVSDLGQGIAELNRQITAATGSGSQTAPNDLLDQRDAMVQELSEFTSVNTISQSNGTLDVIIGGGISFVSGSSALNMVARQGDPDPSRTEIALTDSRGSTVTTLSGERLGGALGGLYSVREQVLIPTLDDLGLTALGLADAMNQAQAQGLDLQGNVGGNIFTDINDPTLAAQRIKSNSTTLQASVAITDMQLLQAGEYEVKYDQASDSYTLVDGISGDSETVANPGVPGTLTFSSPRDGFELVLDSGAPSDGDTLLISPTRGGLSGVEVVMSSPKGIAASSRVEITRSETGSGKMQIELVSVDDTTDANFPAVGGGFNINVVETAADTFAYNITDIDGNILQANQPYAPPSQQIAFGGMTMAINGQGTTSNNDYNQFAVSDGFGSGNGNNALAMSSLQTEKWLGDGGFTLAESFRQTVTEVGTKTSAQKTQSEVASSLYDMAQQKMESLSGVNLDEEAANLIKFQQAYAAAAQVISASQTVFDSLLQAVR